MTRVPTTARWTLGVRATLLPILALALAVVATPSFAQSTGEPEPRSALLTSFDEEAVGLRTMFTQPIVTQFLDAVRVLPEPPPRVIHQDTDSGQYIADSVVADAPRENLRRIELDPDRYYLTKYGTPLAYARVLEACGAHGMTSLEGKRILDFGYGTIGHLRLMAMNGAHVVGVDVDSLLTALYADANDVGIVHRPDGEPGSIALVEGFWPGDDSARKSAGDGFDVITSKNTLKRGYINPARQPDPDVSIDLGVSDEDYLAAVHASLKPGGLFVIYNICPPVKPAPEAYVPWADGRSPWSREQFAAAGFEVLTFDVDDNSVTHAMASALKWDEGERPMNIIK